MKREEIIEKIFSILNQMDEEDRERAVMAIVMTYYTPDDDPGEKEPVIHGARLRQVK